MFKPKTLLMLLLAVILVSRLVAAARTGAPSLEGDAGHYHDIATNLSHGDGFGFSPEMQYPWERDDQGSVRPTARRPPLFPLLLSGLYRLGLPPQAMLFLNALLETLTGWVLWRLALAIGLGMRGALLSTAIYAVYPPFISHSVRLLTETPYILLLTASMLALARGLADRTPGRFVLAGLLLGLATLTRPTTLFLPLALLPLVVWPLGRAPRGWLLLVAVFALTQAPWVIRNATTFGKFEPTFTSRGYNLFMGSYPPTRGLSNLPPERQPPELIASLEGKNEFEINRLYQRAALRNLREEPAEVFKLVLAKAVLCWFNTRPEEHMFLPTPRSFVVNGPLLILGIAGFLLLLREGRSGMWIPVLVIAYFVATHLASVATVRYNLPSMPFLLLGAGAALDRLLARFGSRGRTARETAA